MKQKFKYRYYRVDEDGNVEDLERPKDYSVYKYLAIIGWLAFMVLAYAGCNDLL